MAQIVKKTSKTGRVSYLIRVSEGYRSDGVQIKRSMTYVPEEGMTSRQIEKEVQRQAVLFEENCNTGLYLDQSITLEKFIETWWSEYGVPHLKQKTIHGYKQCLERILPALGHLKIGKITPAHLLKFYANLAEEGMRKDLKYTSAIDIKSLIYSNCKTKQQFSDKSDVCIFSIDSAVNGKNVTAETAQKIANTLGLNPNKAFKPSNSKNTLSDKFILAHHRVLSTILQAAVQWQVIPSNPCTKVKPPKVTRTEGRFLNDVEVLELFGLLEKAPLQYNCLITLLVYSGMRRGEVCGLKWYDIDFNNKMISIRREIMYLPETGIYEDTPKTNESNRVIKLADTVFILLEQHRKAQILNRLKLGDRWEDSKFVFTQWDGKPLHPDSLTSWFRKFIAKTGLPYVNIHSLRHTNASLLIANGVNIATVSKRLGHSSTDTTTKIYTHAIRSADEAAAEVLQDILSVSKNNLTRHQ